MIMVRIEYYKRIFENFKRILTEAFKGFRVPTIYGILKNPVHETTVV